MIKRYPITAKNSTVCGYPGRQFDWSKFDWKGETLAPRELARGITTERRAPFPWVDGSSLSYYEYLHVPYEWSEHMTIYRVRPSSFEAGKKRYGKLIKSVKAEVVNGQGFWVLETEEQNSK